MRWILTVLVSISCGGLGGAVFNYIAAHRPASVSVRAVGDVFAIGKPLLGVNFVLENSGPRPGIVTAADVNLTGVKQGRRLEVELEPAFTSAQTTTLTIDKEGKLHVSPDPPLLTFFTPLMIPGQQDVSTTVWFQQKKGEFEFEGAAYKCSGTLTIWTGTKTDSVPIEPFSFVLTEEQAHSLATDQTKNTLMVVPLSVTTVGH